MYRHNSPFAPLMEFSILVFDDGGNRVFQGKILAGKCVLEKCEIVTSFLESICYTCGLIINMLLHIFDICWINTKWCCICG